MLSVFLENTIPIFYDDVVVWLNFKSLYIQDPTGYHVELIDTWGVEITNKYYNASTLTPAELVRTSVSTFGRGDHCKNKIEFFWYEKHVVNSWGTCLGISVFVGDWESQPFRPVILL